MQRREGKNGRDGLCTDKGGGDFSPSLLEGFGLPEGPATVLAGPCPHQAPGRVPSRRRTVPELWAFLPEAVIGPPGGFLQVS